MACPFFIPTERFDNGGWPHRPRLPLGDGWRGLCTASVAGQVVPSDDELRQFCNLGYAAQCRRLPAERHFDAARFSVARDRDQRIEICYVLEAGHRPGAHGVLSYDAAARRWAVTHPDPRVQAMAACYLESYFERRQKAPFDSPRSLRAGSAASNSA